MRALSEPEQAELRKLEARGFVVTWSADWPFISAAWKTETFFPPDWKAEEPLAIITDGAMIYLDESGCTVSWINRSGHQEVESLDAAVDFILANHARSSLRAQC